MKDEPQSTGEDDDVIDIDDPEDLAFRGFKRIQIEGDDVEYLLDGEGNIYNLEGELVGTTNGDMDLQDFCTSFLNAKISSYN